MAEQARMGESWRNQKLALVQRGRLNSVFIEIEDVAVTERSSRFEPLLLTHHAKRLGELVDKCLSLRKEIRELEILAVKASKDFDLFEQTSIIDEQIEVLRLQLPTKRNESEGYSKGAAALIGAEDIGRGLAEIAKGREAALLSDIKASEEIELGLKQRWVNLRAFHQDYHARHNDPGNAHNFGKRAELLLSVLIAQMQEALDRCVALAEGVTIVYGVRPTDRPTSLSADSLDRFAVWTLELLRSISLAGESESVSEVVIPLTQPWFSREPLITPNQFDRLIANANEQLVSIPFIIPDNGVLDTSSRLKAVGLSFGNAFNPAASGIDRNQTHDLYTRVCANVITPAQRTSDGRDYLRPQLLLGNVCLHSSGGPVALVDGPTVENLRPFGDWIIQLHPWVVWKTAERRLLGGDGWEDAIRDLKLTFRLYRPGRI